MNTSNHLNDSIAPLNRSIYSIDDDTAKQLYAISKRHIALAREHIDLNTTTERRREIALQIKQLRLDRNLLINNHINLNFRRV